VDAHDQTPDIERDRRRFLQTAGLAIGAVGAGSLAMAGSAQAQARSTREGTTQEEMSGRPVTASSFGRVKQIEAGVLNVRYVEAGPAHGRPVILMHGFPYDIHSYVEVAPLLAAEGYRVIVPYFRGYGTTSFLSPATPRNVDQVAFALDILALMDALKIESALLAGYDWGSRTGDIIAALWPKRCKALVSVSGYLITNLAANKLPLPPAAENDWWYQYYFDTELVDVASLPSEAELAAGFRTYYATSGRPVTAPFVQTLFELGLQQPDGMERELGTAIGRLRQASSPH
jgi:pimeloyl-ACP methyl ester carboxylesterase